MKTKKQSVDEIFREGLENFSEQPSRKLWWRVSWKLLKAEVSHLDFTNILNLQTLVPASLVIVGLVAVYNYYSFDVSSESSFSIGQETTSSIISEIDDRSVPLSDTLAIHAPNSEKPFTSFSIGTPEPDDNYLTIRQHDHFEHIPFFQEIIKGSTMDTSTYQAISFTDTFADRPAGVDFPLENEEVQVLTHQTLKDFTGTSIRDILPEPDLSIEEELPSEIKISSRQVPVITPLPIFTPEVIELPVTDMPTILKTSEELTRLYIPGYDAETGKPISLNSLNYSMIYLFRGDYKPPRRDFQTLQYYQRSIKKSWVYLSAYLSPETLFNPEMTPSARLTSYHSGISLSRNTGNYTLEAGLEIGQIDDVGSFMVSLGTYDSIGFYNYIRGFHIDPDNPGYIVFDIQQIGVWDSVKYQSLYNTRNRYAYLNIPLMAGYQAWNQGFFAVYLKFGPVFSYLLRKQEPLPEIYLPGTNVYAMDNRTLKRSDFTVQALISLSLRMQASEKIGVLAEPYYRRYLSDVYDLNGIKMQKPYGIGFRAGLFYAF